jgi:polysaccharide export outer membrane protein
VTSRSAVPLVAVALLAGCASPAGRTGNPAPLAAPTADPLDTRPMTAELAGPDGTGIDAVNELVLSRTPPPAEDHDLPIGVGDLIEISVFEVEELSRLKVRVPQRGVVRLPLLGQVRAAGRSVSQLEEDIRERLGSAYMHDPQVSVFVVEQRSQTVSVVGAVVKGGMYPLTSRLRLSDALALAEGLTAQADTTVYLVRRVSAEGARRLDAAHGAGSRATRRPAGELVEVTVPIDLEALARGREELNVTLEAGDVIHVPRAGTYYVGGAVERAGSFPLRAGTTVQQAIVAAGGVKEIAAWGDVRLYRVSPNGDREIVTVDLDEIEAGRQQVPELRERDVVIVGKHAGKAILYGVRDFMRGAFGMSKGF